MRGILGCVISLLLLTSPAMLMAKRAAGDNPAPAKAGATGPAAGSEAASSDASGGTKADSSSLEVEIDELRDLLQSQSKQLQIQNEQLNEQQKKMERLEDQVRLSNSGRADLSATPASASAAVPSAPSALVLASATASQPTVAATPIAAQGGGAPPASPLQLQVGNMLIQPVGFMDFTGVFRNKNTGGGIGSNFGNLPYEFTNAAGTTINLTNHVTEARLSMQNSRVGFRMDGLFRGAHVIGYTEWDFLGNNPANVAVSSNSNTFRSRLYWVDISKNKWEVLAGQTWSLITPNRAGISPLPGNVFFGNDIDVNYQAGLVWGRIPEIRFVYRPTMKAAIAVALDNQEQYVGGSAGGPNPLIPTAGTVVNGISGLFASNQVNNGSQTTNSSQLFPDVIVKAAFDPSPKFHAEVGGVERQFRIAVGATSANNSAIVHQGLTGGGVFLNLNAQLFNGFRLVTNNYYSSAGGRYIYGLVPDFIVRPDGHLVGIRSGSTVTGFEYTHKNTLVYAYYGAVYAFKNIATSGGVEYGYGVDATGPGSTFSSAIAQNKSIQEETLGFNQTLWRDTRYGALNFMGQMSYLSRNPWSVAPHNPTNANLLIGFINLRYTLPGAAAATSALK